MDQLTGSSPLTRGKLRKARATPLTSGLIPAHAGKTTLSQVGGYPSGAHPRSRGENAARPALRIWRGGSSPLTRGKPHLVDLDHESQGLIPAHAGKTAPEGRTESLPRAHPRSRGENIDGDRATAEEWGSSPLTRGKRDRRLPSRVDPRLIPAHAGKTARERGSKDSRAAHPRSRGENGALDESAHTMTGSSPLTRGKQGVPGFGSKCERLIPAHAGKTAGCIPGTQPWRAHPRSRGENGPWPPKFPPASGSSPLTRGKP